MKITIDIPEALYDRISAADYTVDEYEFAERIFRADIVNICKAVKDGNVLEVGIDNG